MKILLDTNVLVQDANDAAAVRRTVDEHLQRLVSDGAVLCIAPQNVFEFWVVATRPTAVSGLGFSTSVVKALVERMLRIFSLLNDPPDLLGRWLDLCMRYNVSGRPAHDARLVAWMLGHGIKHVVTLNKADFERYAEIECLVPSGSTGR